jgi:hypothetical protein
LSADIWPYTGFSERNRSSGSREERIASMSE